MTAAFGAVLHSCQEQTAVVFDDRPSVYFYNGWLDNIYKVKQADSISYSFFLAEGAGDREQIMVEVCLSGDPLTEPRPISIVQTNAGEADAAVAGVHFVAFDQSASTAVIPAGSVRTSIPVTLLRDPSLRTHEVRLEMKLVENDFFVPGVKEQSGFLIKISDMIKEPTNWASAWRKVFGTWGQVKMKFIIDYVGFSEFDERVSLDMEMYLNTKAREKLIQYNLTAEKPLTEDDQTTPVEFPIYSYY